jgi:hypothetical protein
MQQMTDAHSRSTTGAMSAGDTQTMERIDSGQQT